MNKKLLKLISIFCIALFSVMLANEDSVKSILLTSNTKLNYYRGKDINNPIKILEIEPGDIFKLTKTGGISIDPAEGDSNKIKIPQVEKISEKIEDKYVTVTHMSMPEFISRVDDINGQFDVLVIGRANIKYRGENDWDEVKGLSSTVDYNKGYIDYTNPYSTIINGKNAFLENYNEVEYYSENDLTEKRLNHIKEFINSNQLVYIDNNIGKDEYTEKIGWVNEDKTIKNTKLYQLYNLYNYKENFKRLDGDKINLNEIIRDYSDLEEDKKRPIIDGEDNISASIDNNNEFKINIKTYEKDDLYFKLYIDIDGDGLYKEDENVSNIKSNIIEKDGNFTDYEISTVINENFWGYLGWKLEVIKGNGIKSIIVGSNNIKRDVNIPKKEIKVLQLFPSYWSSYSEDAKPKEFEGNSKFEELCDKIKDDFTINIIRKRIDDFDKEINNGTDEINGKYNVVIIGFGKNDSVGSYSEKLSPKMISEIKEFIKSGQSMIFTADTMSSIIPDKDNDTSTITQAFRDSIGLSRFKDPFNQSETDFYGNKINHMALDDKSKYSAGLSSSEREMMQNNKNYVKIINKTQATTYPFNLNNEIIEISKYDVPPIYQLNLEDEDVVPIFNYLNNGHRTINSGDSRNFYHTYFKGNIMYCGSLPDFNVVSARDKFPETELKLFINTIINSRIKSQQNLNAAPIIDSIYLNKELQNNQVIKLNSINDGFNFKTKASDSDDDMVDLKVKIDGSSEVFTRTNGFKPQGTELEVHINKDKLREVFNRDDKTIRINIIAEDINGLIDEANYIIDLSEFMSIQYGIYIDKNQINEVEKNKFPKGSIVTMAAKVNSGNEINCTLVVDKNNKGLTIVEQPKAYKIEGESLIPIDNISITNNEQFNIPSSYASNIIIIYSVKIPKDTTATQFEGEFNVNHGDISKRSEINVISNLPDLF